jgi:hypothetical protein
LFFLLTLKKQTRPDAGGSLITSLRVACRRRLYLEATVFGFKKGSRYTDRFHQIATRPDVGGKFSFYVTLSGLPQAVVSRGDAVRFFKKGLDTPIDSIRSPLDQTLVVNLAFTSLRVACRRRLYREANGVLIFEKGLDTCFFY